MNSFKTIVERNTGSLYIFAWKAYSGYDGAIKYGATATCWETLEDLEDIACQDEAEAVTAWARLVEKYR